MYFFSFDATIFVNKDVYIAIIVNVWLVDFVTLATICGADTVTIEGRSKQRDVNKIMRSIA